MEVKGRFNIAKIFTDVVDDVSIDQVKLLCEQEFVSGSKIRLMPDIHAGAGCTIGTTMTVIDKVVPNLVGVDIGCGMLTCKLQEKEIDLKLLDDVIRRYVPSGFKIRSSFFQPFHENVNLLNLESLICIQDKGNKIDLNRAKLSIGTLGGGNHFIEIDRDDDGNLYLVIHSGSRHLGLEVAHHYQNKAWDSINNYDKKQINELVEKLKSEGREKEIQNEIKKFKGTMRNCNIPKDLAYLSGKDFDDYIYDMSIVQEFARINRKTIADEICSHMNLHVDEEFTTIHNYIDIQIMILRKGAVSAKLGEKLLIPINMRDGSLICIGKGNEDWNYSAPHGAGRLMSRTQAKKEFSIKEFENQMAGIYTTSIGFDTLDECPMAYKNIEDIINNIGPTAEIISIIKPIYNFKAGESNE